MLCGGGGVEVRCCQDEDAQVRVDWDDDHDDDIDQYGDDDTGDDSHENSDDEDDGSNDDDDDDDDVQVKALRWEVAKTKTTVS